MKDPNKKDEEQQPEIPDWLKAVYIPINKTMSFDMLCKAVSKETGLPVEKVKEAVSNFEKVAYELINQGETVNLPGLGKFYRVLNEGGNCDANDEFEVRFEPSETLLERIKERVTKDPSMN